jgi:transposase
MQNYKWFMGIDVSKAKLDITLLKGSEKVFYQMIDNDEEGLIGFIKSLKDHKEFKWEECLVCAEHTGIYNAHLLTIAQKYKWHLCLESGMQIKKSGGLQRGKNDIVDSYRIAVYACKNVNFLKLWQPSRAVLESLKKLATTRCRLITVRTQLSTALKEDKKFTDKKLMKTLEQCNKRSLAALDKDIKLTEKKIQDVIASDKELKMLFDIVESVPGIGSVIAVQMLTTTGEFKQITDPRQYACYSGVAPFEHSSGSSIRGRTKTSKMANQYVKSLLYMGAMVAVRCCPEMKQYYDRKVAEGKNKMSVINAVKNKLIHRVFACVERKQLYQINYKNSLAVS